MDNYYKSNENSYEWQTLSQPIVKSEERSEEVLSETDTEVKHQIFSFNAPILTFQLIICLLIITFSFITKCFFSELYGSIKDRYDREINSTMLLNGNLEDFDFSRFFEATHDEM